MANSGTSGSILGIDIGDDYGVVLYESRQTALTSDYAIDWEATALLRNYLKI